MSHQSPCHINRTHPRFQCNLCHTEGEPRSRSGIPSDAFAVLSGADVCCAGRRRGFADWKPDLGVGSVGAGTAPLASPACELPPVSVCASAPTASRGCKPSHTRPHPPGLLR
eukprot:379089-Rhodomonas_salina.5